MKTLRALSLFLSLGMLCHPIYVSAEEGFSWKVISEESPEISEFTEDVVSADTFTDSKAENSDDDSASQKDSESDDKNEDSNDDENAEATDDSKNSEDTDDSKDSEDIGDDEASEEENTPSRKETIYPSGKNIYSSSEISEMIDDKYQERKEALALEDPFKKTKTVDRINSFILNFAEDPLEDKKIAFLGDSITAGNGGSLTPDGSGLNYTDYISQYTSAEIINLGIGGAPYDGYDNDDAIIYRYKDIPEDTDIIVLFAGINDLFAGSEHFGSLDNPTKGTYCGDIYATFKAIDEDYSDAEVYVVITYPNKMEEYTQFTGENWQEYADVQIELADEFGYNVIDLYREGFMDSKDSKVRNAFFLDDIHPDDLGSEVLGRHILVHILKNYL